LSTGQNPVFFKRYKEIKKGRETMKTFRDFDLTEYRKIAFEIGIEKGFSNEQCEKALDFMLEKGKDELTTEIHCLTCGVKFPLNNLQHECQEEDIWLYHYVKNSEGNKQLKKQFISKLKAKYPLRKGNGLAFRGINFPTKESYELFMKEIELGTYHFDTISSWSLNYSYAKRFARCMQKGTKVDDSVRKTELRNMYNQKANITGYKGIVLGIDLTKKMTLCDISEENIGSMNEYEVVLLPGTYRVHVMTEIEKEIGNTEWDEEIIKRAEQL
jgi:hypothetical protein